MKKNAGFTLMEIMVVLTVIGLLIGGIFAGRALIRNSQLQAVLSEYQQYSSAIKNFQDKYQALPGDYFGAETTWTPSAGCTSAAGVATGNAGTCKGNGNGYIDMTYLEHIAAWRHLGLSGFVSGNYSGNVVSDVCTTTAADNMSIKASENVPASKLKATSWNIAVNSIGIDYATGVAATTFFPMNAAIDRPKLHALRLGGSLQDDAAVATYSCSQSQIPVMTAEEAYQMDSKNDDGAVTTGRIRGMFNNTTDYDSCNSGTAATGGYKTTAAGANCAIAFILD